MNGVPPFTTLLAVDAAHLDMLRTVWPTWVKHRPEITQNPILVAVDALETRGGFGKRCNKAVLEIIQPGQAKAGLGVVYWRWPCVRYDAETEIPQRERMLTSFAHMANVVQTPWWLKLDCDVIATRGGPWLDPAWFDQDTHIVASPWGYTKPANAIETLDAWAEERGLAGSPLGLKAAPGATRIRHPRIISYVMFGSRELGRLAWSLLEGGRLPVPSQDTYHWYLAQRLGLGIRKVRMSNLGWEHSKRNLRERAERALA